MADTGMTPLVTSGYRRAGGPRFLELHISYDEDKLRRIERVVSGIPNAMNRIVPPTLNTTAGEMKTWLYKELVERTGIIRKKSVRDRLTVTPKASGGSWRAGLRVALTRFTIFSFATQQTATGTAWYPGMLGTWRFIPHAFIQRRYTHPITGETMDVGQVYRRTRFGEKGFDRGAATRRGDMVRRYPIRVLRGPSLALLFSKDARLQAKAEGHGGEVLEKKMQQQVARVIGLEVPK